MKFLITTSLIIGTVFLLGASTSSNAINIQSLIKSSNVSNIVKVRGGHIGGGGMGHSGNFGHHGNFHHDNNFSHHREWNEGVGVGVGVGVGIGDAPSYIEGPGYDYDAGPACVGPFCDVEM